MSGTEPQRGDVNMEDDEICFECVGRGEDYYINDEGELICACDDCWIRKRRSDDYDDATSCQTETTDKDITS